MPAAKPPYSPFDDLVHKLIKSFSDDKILKIIIDLMTNTELYHDKIISEYVKHHHTDVQKLYFNAIKAFAQAVQFALESETYEDAAQKKALNDLAINATESAQNLLNQYALFKPELMAAYKPDHLNTRAKEIADAYLQSLDEHQPLTDYQLFVFAYHYANPHTLQSPENVVATTVLKYFKENFADSPTTTLSEIYALLNRMIAQKIHFLTGNQEQHKPQHSATEAVFFKRHTKGKATTRESSMQTYLDHIQNLEHRIDTFQNLIAQSLPENPSKELKHTILILQHDLAEAYQQLLHDRHEITAYHYITNQ